MTVSNLKKKQSSESDDRSFRPDSHLLFRLTKKFLAVFLLTLLLIFICSSSTLIISTSITHVCVTSRKLGSRYCISAGAHPITYDVPIINNNTTTTTTPTSTTSYIERGSTNGYKVDNVDKDKAPERVDSRKVVEAQLAILRSYIAKPRPPPSSGNPCEGRGIYVYDLPPKFNDDLVAKCDEIMPWLNFCKYLSNDAMGEPILELGEGWYNTHQFSLEPIFHRRVLKHPCRVDKEEEAKLFYVPFYGALDMLWSHFSHVNVTSNDVEARVYELSREIVGWLKEQRMWKRHLGLDHVFVLGKNSWDLRRSKYVPWGTPLLEFDELQNPIKLIIERHPWHMNDVGVPYPSYFHPGSDKEIVEWQERIRVVPRRYLVSFAGATRKDPTSIRSILIEQCTSALPLGVCKFLNCGEKLCVESAPVVELFMESEFCLQPDGDSPTRKSVFDSLIAGCIPVVFDLFTAHYQYPWHLPEDHTKYSVFIDQAEVKKSEVNVVEKLMNIPLKQRQEMRKYVINELPKLVYAHANAKLEKFEDAFTIAVNNSIQMAISRLA